jgi:hypothetical protein
MMVQEDRVDGLRQARRIYVIIGGGSTHESTCPDLTEALKRRGEGDVVAMGIDHDRSALNRSEARLRRLGVRVTTRHLFVEEYQYSLFTQKAQEMGFRGLDPREDAADNPRQIRVLLELYADKIAEDIREMLPEDGEAVEVVLVWPIGVTGTTSSVVGLDGASRIKDALNARRKERPLERQWDIRNIGLVLVSPNPSDGAGPYNKAHGYRVAKRLKKIAHQFYALFMFDGGGIFGEELPSYIRWASDAAATILTSESLTGDGDAVAFQDRNEFFQNLPGHYVKVSLLRAGFFPEEVQLARFLVKLGQGEFPEVPPLLAELDVYFDIREALNRGIEAQSELAKLEADAPSPVNPAYIGHRKKVKRAKAMVESAKSQLRRLALKAAQQMDERIQERKFRQLRATPSFGDCIPALVRGESFLSGLPYQQKMRLHTELQTIKLHASTRSSRGARWSSSG